MESGLMKQIQPDWTLFLDRDGVINYRPPGDYVKTINEFRFLPGTLKALSLLSAFFSKIIVVTNQQGVGKGLMTINDLDAIHAFMLSKINKSGGRIDNIYCCTELATNAVNCRKPNLTMAHWAKTDYPEIEFNKAVMVGDTESDIEFGKRGGMFVIYLGSDIIEPVPDARFESLIQFAEIIHNNTDH